MIQLPVNSTKSDKHNREWLRRIPNARYKTDQNMSAVLQRGIEHRLNMFVEKSAFFSDMDDHEAKEKANYNAISKANPEFILSKANALETKKKTQNPNNIRKEVMTDPGRQTFDYEKSGDQVGLVREGVSNYMSRYNRFFDPKKQAQINDLHKTLNV